MLQVLKQFSGRIAIFSVGLGMLLSAVSAAAQDTVIGHIKTVQSEASIQVGDKNIKALPGMPVQTGYVLKTGPQGSMGVTFRDNTMMSFGPNTELVVDEYLYAPGKGELKLGATMARGTVQYISGVIAKLKPDAVQLKTPAGIIGVRGTRYVALVEEARP